MSLDSGIVAMVLGGVMIGGLLSANAIKEGYSNYPTNPQFYAGKQNNQPLKQFRGPSANISADQQSMNIDNSGTQLLSYQLYQQAVNAATPTLQQLNSISGQSEQQTGPKAAMLGGGLSANVAPYSIMNVGNNTWSSEFQAVNLGSERAQSISACAQNAPSFVATSLLPKPAIPGQEAWDIGAPSNILANQNFLSATQQIGVDTVLGSNRNSSGYDIRNSIPNPINVISPFNNTTITPSLEKRPLDCFINSGQGMYGCASSGGANEQGTFVGMGS